MQNRLNRRLASELPLIGAVAVALALAGCTTAGGGTTQQGDAAGGSAQTNIVLPPIVMPQPASYCATNYGACMLAPGIRLTAGSGCYCPSMWGPIWGTAR